MIPAGPYMDMHTHILPGLDDGSQSMDCTRNMLREAYAEGVRVIVATPHFGIRNTGFRLSEAEEVLRETQAVADEVTPGLKILLGNELFYSDGVVESLKRGEAKTIGGSSYALVEFSTRDSYDRITQCIREMSWNGYRPLIAHVERYRCLEGDIDAVRSLVDQGAVLQVNCRSFLGGAFSGHISGTQAADDAGKFNDSASAGGSGASQNGAGAVRSIASQAEFGKFAPDSSSYSNSDNNNGTDTAGNGKAKRHGLFGKLLGGEASPGDAGGRHGRGGKGRSGSFFLEEKTEWVRELLKADLIHLIASDCHDDNMRCPVYRSALTAMEPYATEAQLEAITRGNVLKLIRNERIV